MKQRDSIVGAADPPPKPDLDEINKRLTAGLATCRSVIANYKSLLTNADVIETPGTAASERELPLE
jgi:hypothetical protein